MNIRHCKMRSGKIFTLYEIKRFHIGAGLSEWKAFIGSSTTRPRWVKLNFPSRTYNKVKPWLYFDGEKIYLSSFESA